jgi:hypothetical protein
MIVYGYDTDKPEDVEKLKDFLERKLGEHGIDIKEIVKRQNERDRNRIIDMGLEISDAEPGL